MPTLSEKMDTKKVVVVLLILTVVFSVGAMLLNMGIGGDVKPAGGDTIIKIDDPDQSGVATVGFTLTEAAG